jgi:hypothetical protein
VTLQTHAPENFRLCRCGDERTRQACADGERGPPSARAEICVSFLSQGSTWNDKRLWKFYLDEKFILPYRHSVSNAPSRTFLPFSSYSSALFIMPAAMVRRRNALRHQQNLRLRRDAFLVGANIIKLIYISLIFQGSNFSSGM